MSDIDRLKHVAQETEGVVEQWFFEAFHGSLVARSTEVWNAVHAAKEDLKQRLAELFATHSSLPNDSSTPGGQSHV